MNHYNNSYFSNTNTGLFEATELCNVNQQDRLQFSIVNMFFEIPKHATVFCFAFFNQSEMGKCKLIFKK